MLSKQLTDGAIVQRIAVPDKATGGSRPGAPAVEGTTVVAVAANAVAAWKSTAMQMPPTTAAQNPGTRGWQPERGRAADTVITIDEPMISAAITSATAVRLAARSI